VCVSVHVCVCVSEKGCVCERETAREREREKDRSMRKKSLLCMIYMQVCICTMKYVCMYIYRLGMLAQRYARGSGHWCILHICTCTFVQRGMCKCARMEIECVCTEMLVFQVVAVYDIYVCAHMYNEACVYVNPIFVCVQSHFRVCFPHTKMGLYAHTRKCTHTKMGLCAQRCTCIK